MIRIRKLFERVNFPVAKKEYTFPSADGHTTLHGCFWIPETAPKGILQIAHGITEHMGRYEELGEYFSSRGYVVAGHDHIGHGASIDPENPLPMYFGPKGSWQFVVDDLRNSCNLSKQQFPGIPLCLLGLSLGSFAVRCLQGQTPDIADMGIWVGTDQMNPMEIAIASAITWNEQRRFGETKDTPLLHKLTMDSYNKHYQPRRTRVDWLLSDPEAADAYLADPLCGEGFTVSAFRELLSGAKLCCRKSFLAKMNRSVPILILSGAEDAVGGHGKKPALIRDLLQELQFEQVHMHIFPNMRHDILRETDHMDVFRYIEEKIQTLLLAK